jgi:hypothetical protein
MDIITTTPATDPLAVVEALDPEAIRTELADLHRREAALRVLLRAAVARQRPQRSVPAGKREEAGHA